MGCLAGFDRSVPGIFRLSATLPSVNLDVRIERQGYNLTTFIGVMLGFRWVAADMRESVFAVRQHPVEVVVFHCAETDRRDRAG